MQASLDPLDIETLYPLISKSSNLGVLNQPTDQEWKEWLARWNSRELAEEKKQEEDEERIRDLILAYLVSATFKDCSIFFRQDFSLSSTSTSSSFLSTSPLPADRTTKEENILELKIIDLDQKPIGKFRGYFELDKKIWSGFKEMLDTCGGEQQEIRRCYV